MAKVRFQIPGHCPNYYSQWINKNVLQVVIRMYYVVDATVHLTLKYFFFHKGSMDLSKKKERKLEWRRKTFNEQRTTMKILCDNFSLWTCIVVAACYCIYFTVVKYTWLDTHDFFMPEIQSLCHLLYVVSFIAKQSFTVGVEHPKTETMK